MKVRFFLAWALALLGQAAMTKDELTNFLWKWDRHIRVGFVVLIMLVTIGLIALFRW